MEGVFFFLKNQGELSDVCVYIYIFGALSILQHLLH